MPDHSEIAAVSALIFTFSALCRGLIARRHYGRTVSAKSQVGSRAAGVHRGFLRVAATPRVRLAKCTENGMKSLCSYLGPGSQSIPKSRTPPTISPLSARVPVYEDGPLLLGQVGDVTPGYG
jgi:hypothetical protein